MNNHKSELLETVETVSEFAGTLAGKIVICSREISDCVKNMMIAKPEPPTKATESIKNQAKERIAAMVKEETAAKQTKLKKDTEKSKGSSGSQRCQKPRGGKKNKHCS